MAKGVRRAPKINERPIQFGWLNDSFERHFKKIKNLIALRDEVLKRYEGAKKTAEKNRELSMKWRQLYKVEAIFILEPLKKLADKCK